MMAFIALIVIDVLGSLAASFCLVLLVNHGRLALLAARTTKSVAPTCSLDGSDRPKVLLQIPVYNEPESVEEALLSAAQLDWPRDKFCIQLLDDSTDHTSMIAAKVISRLKSTGIIIEHIRRPNRAGFKAGALAEGLKHCQAPLVAILDADFRAPPDWLDLAVSRLQSDPAAGFVQFRFEHANRNHNILTMAQQLSADTHFFVEQAGRLAANEPFQFNGTAGVWRRAAIDAAGGWAGDTLTEDLDLVLRAYKKGWHGALVLHPAVICEAPSTLAAWRAQQARWSKGFMQVTRRALPSLWRMPWTLSKKIAVSLFLAVQMAFPCAMAAAAAMALDAGLRGGIGAGHIGVAGAAVCIAALFAVLTTYPVYRRLHRGSGLRYGMILASLPALLGFLAVVNSYGIVSAVFGRGGEFVRTPKSGGSVQKSDL